MKTFSAALALVVAVPCSAGTLLPAERVAAIAAAAGLAAPAPAALEAPRFAPVKARTASLQAADPVRSGSANGSGWLTGSGWLHCSSHDPQRPGWFSGWIRLDGDVRVYGPDGTTGSVRVDGSIHVSGSCANGSGFAHGSGRVSGRGYLYKDGRPAGTADVSGTVFLNRYVHGHAFFSEHVSVSGFFTANP
jgi:hypothetical protein